MFAKKSIFYIHILGMFGMLLFTLLFIVLVIHEEYSDFDKESVNIRKEYIANQKKSIVFDTNRILDYIRYEYLKKDKSKSTELLQLNILNVIEHLYRREDGTGYIFIYDMNGTKLSDPIQSNNIGQNFYNYKDIDGVQVIKELIEVAKQPSGGFVEYKWKKPDFQELVSKISYAKSFEPWGWMVGTGFYLDEVEKHIAFEREALKKRLVKYMMETLTLGTILLVLGYILLKIVNLIITNEVETFTRFFESASKSDTKIDIDAVRLEEFRQMVVHINRMIAKIHARKKHLRELNLNLEKKVAQKTLNIAEQNRLLAIEKEFSESIIQAQDSFIKHSIHEINTPLAVIMTHIDIYKMKHGENRYLTKIEAASKMISNIYDDLSYMVKKNRLVYNKERINMSRFLQDRILFFEEIALGNRHPVYAEIEDGIEIYFNDIKLQRIIDNNLSNSIKYAKKNTTIRVTLTQSDTTVIMSFFTNSSKIEDIDKIFEAYHREDHRASGFGLGLEIVGSICKEEQVTIKVNSTELVTEFSYLFDKQTS